MKIGERRAQRVIEHGDAGLVRCGTGLWSVVDEVGERLVERFPIALALNFFGVASYDRYCGFISGDGHLALLQLSVRDAWSSARRIRRSSGTLVR